MQRKQLEEFQAFLLDKFQKHLREHQNAIALSSKEHAAQLAQQAQQLAQAHDLAISDAAQYMRDADATLNNLRERLHAAEEQHSAIAAENLALKSAHVADRAELQRDKEEKIRQYEETIVNLRQDLQVSRPTPSLPLSSPLRVGITLTLAG